MSLKLAISGKGGVGKSTVAGTLARLYAADGRRVLAIDADSDANLAPAIGLPPEVRNRLRTIAEERELIEERTGVREYGRLFKLNQPGPDRLAAVLSNQAQGLLGVSGEPRKHRVPVAEGEVQRVGERVQAVAVLGSGTSALVKIAVLAPMPRASDRTAVSAKPGLSRSCRMPNFQSCRSESVRMLLYHQTAR